MKYLIVMIDVLLIRISYLLQHMCKFTNLCTLIGRLIRDNSVWYFILSRFS